MRKLAAIMFTDIEGFTKLMQLDESKAVQLLERHKQIYIQHTRQFKGQVVKYLGDGTLTIFSSAIQAVKCAVALQLALQKDPMIPVRIGIHQGDVILENKDVFGDAVNLASRIQTFCIAGGILVSEKAYDELQNHEEIKTAGLGSYNLKNIAHPVNLYAIVADGLKVPGTLAPPESKGAVIAKPADVTKSFRAKILNNPKTLQFLLLLLIVAVTLFGIIRQVNNNQDATLLKTIAVLPFENMDKNESSNFLADGLTEEMISLLTSNLELKIKRVTPAAIKSSKGNLSHLLLNEIRAGCALEGKVQHDKDSLIVFVNLRNTATNQVIWSNTYRREFRDLMKVQQQLALQIAGALNTNFSKNNMKSFVLDRTYNSDAYILYIQGRYALKKRTRLSMTEAIFLFNKALKEDSSFALAYSGIADTYTILIDNGFISYDSGASLARTAVDRAFMLDSSSAEIRASKAIFLSTLEGDRAEALKELKLSLFFSPNYADAHHWYALELAADSQFDSAILHINKAIEIEPFSERIWLNVGLIMKLSRRYKEAIGIMNTLIARSPDNSQQYRNLKVDCHYWLGQKDSVLYYATSGNGPLNDHKFWDAVCNHNKEKLEAHLKEQLAVAPLSNEILAVYYIFLGRDQQALACVEDAYKRKEFSWLKYLNVSPNWDALRKEMRFQDVIQKMGFR